VDLEQVAPLLEGRADGAAVLGVATDDLAPAEPLVAASSPQSFVTMPGARRATSRLESARSRSKSPDGKSGPSLATIRARASSAGMPSRTIASS
jgi:hypothetical protein